MSNSIRILVLILTGLAALPVCAQRQGLATDEDYFQATYNADRYLDERDYEKAFAWLSKSARFGDKAAQHQLALLYLNGLGTDVNYALAYAWSAGAAESKSNQSRKLKSYIGSLFNDQQLEVAKRMAAATVEQYGMDAMDIVCRKKFLENSGRKRVQCFRKHTRESKYQPPNDFRW